MLMDDLFILQMFKKQMFELQSIIKDRAPWKYCKAALAAAAASVTVAAAAAQQLQHQHSAPMQHQKQQQKQRKIEKKPKATNIFYYYLLNIGPTIFLSKCAYFASFIIFCGVFANRHNGHKQFSQHNNDSRATGSLTYRYKEVYQEL